VTNQLQFVNNSNKRLRNRQEGGVLRKL